MKYVIPDMLQQRLGVSLYSLDFFQAGTGAGGDGADDLTEEEGQEILDMKNSNNIYGEMANSVAPTVFGHSEVCAIMAVLRYQCDAFAFHLLSSRFKRDQRRPLLGFNFSAFGIPLLYSTMRFGGLHTKSNINFVRFIRAKHWIACENTFPGETRGPSYASWRRQQADGGRHETPRRH